jgi:predicted ATP-dependent serine protease
MAKGKTSVFFCQECGYESAKWMGRSSDPNAIFGGLK